MTDLGFKIERKNTNQCLGGLRMEDQGVQRPQNYLVKKFFFPQLPRKHEDRSAFK